ncbi:MAG: hypothetical protein ACI9MR_003747 [Myxococcota bacterium]|jgi:hypothetical protein
MKRTHRLPCRLCLVSFATLLWGQACIQHVTLDAPPVTVSFEQRVQAYESLRPKERNTVMVNGSVTNRSITLANGTKVHAPDDLLPVVEPNSDTALYAISSRDDRDIKEGFFGAAFGFVGAGTVAWLIDPPQEGNFTTAGVWTAIGLALGAGVSVIVAMVHDSSADDAAAEAFDAYDHDLQQRLRIEAPGTGAQK